MEFPVAIFFSKWASFLVGQCKLHFMFAVNHNAIKKTISERQYSQTMPITR
jgi:hypothetical protein